MVSDHDINRDKFSWDKRIILSMVFAKILYRTLLRAIGLISATFSGLALAFFGIRTIWVSFQFRLGDYSTVWTIWAIGLISLEKTCIHSFQTQRFIRVHIEHCILDLVSPKAHSIYLVPSFGRNSRLGL